MIRDKIFQVGKTIGKHIWIHQQYHHVLPVNISDYLAHIPDDHPFDILLFDRKTQSLSFIQCPDFDVDNEPAAGDVFKITPDNIGQPCHTFSVKILRASKTNPRIYHHKWLFVQDDYAGFDVAQAQRRSALWQNKIEHTQAIISRIGHRQFWHQWLKDNEISQ
jgi:hypothetical protein